MYPPACISMTKKSSLSTCCDYQMPLNVTFRSILTTCTHHHAGNKDVHAGNTDVQVTTVISINLPILDIS